MPKITRLKTGFTLGGEQAEADPLAEIYQVRGAVEPGAQARRPQRGLRRGPPPKAELAAAAQAAARAAADDVPF